MRKSIYLVPLLLLTMAAPGAGFAADQEALPGGGAPHTEIAKKCLQDISDFEEKLWRVGFGVLNPNSYESSAPPGYSDFYVSGVEPTPRKKMQALRDAAVVYAYDGDEVSCQHAFASMKAVFNEHQKPVGIEGDERDVRTEWRRAHLANSKPVTDMDHLMQADLFIGSEIRNLKDERLGEIKDVVVNPHDRQVLYILASHGGFLGIGSRLVAIRWNDLRATRDHELYVLDVSPKAFDDAPVVDRNNFSQTANAAWRQTLDRYWNKVLHK